MNQESSPIEPKEPDTKVLDAEASDSVELNDEVLDTKPSYTKKVSQVAAVFIGISVALTAIVSLNIYWLMDLLPDFFYSSVMNASWVVGVIIFAIGLCFEEKYSKLKIPAAILTAAFGFIYLEVLFDFISSPGYLWLVVDAALIIYAAALFVHDKSKTIRPLASLAIVFIALNTLAKLFVVDMLVGYGYNTDSSLVNYLAFSLVPHMYQDLIYNISYNQLLGFASCLLNPAKYLLFFGLLLRFVSEKKVQEGALSMGAIIVEPFKICNSNKGALTGAVILWLLTIWIPYINLGTTIGMLGFVVAMSQGRRFSPLEIFSEQYRKQMGGFLLLSALMTIGILCGFSFMIIPGFVLSVAWSQAVLLQVDKGLNPIEAITASNEITYGNKLRIALGGFLVFFIYILLQSVISIGIGIVARSPELMLVIGTPLFIFFIMLMMCFAAHIYRELSVKLNAAE